MEEKSLGVCFNYYKGLFDADELESQVTSLKQAGIQVYELDKTGQVMAFLDEFTNQISIMLSSSLIQAYCLGLLANSTYDSLKRTIFWMWNSLHGKKLTKVQSGHIKEKEATFGLQLKVDQNTQIDFRLTGDVSDELKSRCIDKAFEVMMTVPRGTERRPINWFSSYSWDCQDWIIINVGEEIYNRVQKQDKTEDKK